jgi:hypothetical protein
MATPSRMPLVPPTMATVIGLVEGAGDLEALLAVAETKGLVLASMRRAPREGDAVGPA